MALHKKDAEFFPDRTAMAASTKSALLTGAFLVVGILLVWYAANALLVIFTGILLAVFLNALSDYLRRLLPVSPVIATAIVVVGLVGLVIAGIWLLSPRIAQQAAALLENLPRAFDEIANRWRSSEIGMPLRQVIPQVEEMIRAAGGLMASASWVLTTSVGLITKLVIILFVGIYVTFNPQRYIHGLLLLARPEKRPQARNVVYSIGTTLRRWTLARMLLMISNAILTSIGLWLLDIPFALTLGLIAGLLNFVPNLGPIIAGIPAVLIALLQSPSKALYVAILYLVLQAADGYIFTPLVQQQAVRLPPALTISAQLVMGVLLGPWGLVLATPLVAASIVLIDKLYVEDHDREAPQTG